MALRDEIKTAVTQAFADYEKTKTEEEQQQVFINGCVNVLSAIFQPIVDAQERIAAATEKLAETEAL